MNNLEKAQKRLKDNPSSFWDNGIVVDVKTPKISLFIACDYNDDFDKILETTCKMIYTLNKALSDE